MKLRSKLPVRPRLLLGCCMVAIGAPFCAPSALAQTGEGVETITVTAEKRPENIQSVPMSVTALSGDQLEEANITSIQDVARFIPGLNVVTSNNNRNAIVEIRNTGTSGTNPGIEADVGLFLDGVYIPSAAPILNELADVSTFEVLRGPQGTLYGRNTAVGAINITSRAPTDQFEAMVDLEYGNYDESRAIGYIGGKLLDDVNGRFSFWIDDHAGYEKDIYYNEAVNGTDQLGGRGRLQWTPDSKTTVDFIGFYAKTDGNGYVGAELNPFGPGGIATPGFLAAAKAANPEHPFVALGPYQVNEDDIPYDVTDTFGAQVNASRIMPWGDTLTNILAYNQVEDDIQELSGDGLPQNVGNGTQIDTIRTSSDELRITSPGKQFINYIGGLYLLSESLTYPNIYSVNAGANRNFGTAAKPVMFNPGDTDNFYFGQNTNAVAVYGQTTVDITDQFRAIGGIRYSWDHKDADINNTDYNKTGGPVSPTFIASYPIVSLPNMSRTDRAVTWTAGLQYDITEHVMAYFTAGSGFKDGGYNARAASGGPYTFAPETTQTYEIGEKGIFFDNKLLINADAYEMLEHGLQMASLNPLTGVGFVVDNAGNVRERGVEADLQAHPIDYLSLNGSLTYANTVYTYYPVGQCVTTYPSNLVAEPPPAGSPQPNPAKPGTCNYVGFTPPYSPDWRWSLGARWEQPLRDSHLQWFLATDATYTGSQELDATLDPRSHEDAYTLFDANLGIEPEAGNWRIQLWGKNLANKLYYVGASPQPLGAFVSGGYTAAGKGVGANGFYGWYGTPRTFGIEGSYKF